MTRYSRNSLSTILTLLVCCLFLLPLSASYAALPPLSSPPLGDRWFSISMNGDKVGFVHLNVAKTAEGFTITSEGSAKMLVLGFSREASAHERYYLNRDLTLKSFEVEQIIDKSPLNLSGTVSGRSIKVTTFTKGGKNEKTLKAKGAVYPPPVLNLYPLLKGFAPGRKYSLQVLDVETVKLKDVVINGVAVEKRNGMDTLHMQNDLYTFVDNDIWVDSYGNTIEESVRDGLIITRSENPDIAVNLLFEDVVAKKDLVLDFSLVRIDHELPTPEKLRKLVLDISGYPLDYPLPQGPGQTAARQNANLLRISLATPLRQAGGQLEPADKMRYLKATPRVNSDHPQIISMMQKIIAGSSSSEQSVAMIARWVADFLEDTVTDTNSAFEAMEIRKGNCQTHTRLYAALARAAEIPTRTVSGLVYVKGKGFLYHSWAESYVDGWLAVDPTFGQIPADVTHIRLVEGDEPEEIAPLAGIIGKIKARVIDLAD
ncbi:transglutaminase family protein [Geobacter sp. OR-1]|uniref:transglutaminase-like domain-containing protein n=1 Tax=Geobacter sp. OR-1 TaxID=1266765 RepID=UPI001ED9B3E2|nr:transglutaminase family protein [Geobacter sp. OR-1]